MPTRTAAQRRHEAAAAYQEYVRTCPTQRLLGRLSDKWTSLVLVTLADGRRRYGELSREVPGASQKMLTQTLRALERDGLVERAVTPAVPVRVDYGLTPLGRSLVDLLSTINGWAYRHMVEVETARAEYDVRRGPLGAGLG